MKRNDLLRVKYFIYCLFKRDGYKHADFIKKNRCFHNMGDKCFFQPFNLPADAKQISFGNNVVVASDVKFICHDVIHLMLNNSTEQDKYKLYQGIIDIKDNVFIGSGAVILPDVKIGPNAVIAAGAVVNRDVPEGAVVGGVPAKVIGSFEDLKNARMKYSRSPAAKMDKDKRIAYLWKNESKKHN